MGREFCGTPRDPEVLFEALRILKKSCICADAEVSRLNEELQTLFRKREAVLQDKWQAEQQIEELWIELQKVLEQ